MKTTDFYAINWKCNNCEAGYPYDNELFIRKGMTLKQFSKETECPQCGCKNTIYGYAGTREATEKDKEDIQEQFNLTSDQ